MCLKSYNSEHIRICIIIKSQTSRGTLVLSCWSSVRSIMAYVVSGSFVLLSHNVLSVAAATYWDSGGNDIQYPNFDLNVASACAQHEVDTSTAL